MNVLVKSHSAKVVTLLLVVQAIVVLGLKRTEVKPPLPDLEQVRSEFGDWRMSGKEAMDTPVMQALQPDRYIMRRYNDASGTYATVFAAYFVSSDTTGPHSPRVCLPGSGWTGQSERVLQLDIPGYGSIPVNEYIVEKGDERLAVLYWYQNARRVWADEVMAKVYVLPDLLQYRRSDVALVRVATPIQGNNVGAGTAKAAGLARLVFADIRKQLNSI